MSEKVKIDRRDFMRNTAAAAFAGGVALAAGVAP